MSSTIEQSPNSRALNTEHQVLDRYADRKFRTSTSEAQRDALVLILSQVYQFGHLGRTGDEFTAIIHGKDLTSHIAKLTGAWTRTLRGDWEPITKALQEDARLDLTRSVTLPEIEAEIAQKTGEAKLRLAGFIRGEYRTKPSC